jgi:hypothetical protein
LDGSPAIYYLSKGTGDGSKQFYLYQEGGGFCTDLDDCLKRSRTDLGSSLEKYGWHSEVDLDRPSDYSGFHRDPTLNPLLHSWNHVYLPYCDGAYFSGSNHSTTIVNGTRLYFHGKDIMEAVLLELSSHHGLDVATDVILGGCSAGGMAVFDHLDWVRGHPTIPLNARVAGFPISGWTLDGPLTTPQKAFVYQQSNVSSTLSQACVRDQEALGTPHKCLISDINAPYLQTPVFIFQSKFDADALLQFYDTPCSGILCAMNYSEDLTRSVHDKLWSNSALHGGFMDGCYRHCAWTPNPKDDIHFIRAPDQASPLGALWMWHYKYIQGVQQGTGRIWEQTATTFPCEDCCRAGAGVSMV